MIDRVESDPRVGWQQVGKRKDTGTECLENGMACDISPCTLRAAHGQTYLNSERGAGAHDDARDEREDAGEAAVSHGGRRGEEGGNK